MNTFVVVYYFDVIHAIRYSHGVSSPGRHVRTRLYFTSESHIHSLLTVLRHGGLVDVSNLEQNIFDEASVVSVDEN